jgi:hypothetical protein
MTCEQGVSAQWFCQFYKGIPLCFFIGGGIRFDISLYRPEVYGVIELAVQTLLGQTLCPPPKWLIFSGVAGIG